MEKTKYVAYFRRSKKEQTSTLGLEAQAAEVARHIESTNGYLIKTFTEIESGTRGALKKRTVIWKAIEFCKQYDAILIIAKLDRLARDVEFTVKLQNSQVKFVACDIPYANEFTIQVMAAVAQQEAKRISERTRAALAAKKARGEKLGRAAWRNWIRESDQHILEKARLVRVMNAENNVHTRVAKGYVKALRGAGMTYTEIAKRMNNEGYKSPSGRSIYPQTVKRWDELVNIDPKMSVETKKLVDVDRLIEIQGAIQNHLKQEELELPIAPQPDVKVDLDDSVPPLFFEVDEP